MSDLDQSSLDQGPASPFSVAGHRALVTGAAGGIGRAVAAALARHGARVFLTDVRGDALADLVAELRAQGHEASGLPFDLSQSTGFAEVVQECARSIGEPDILVNMAGYLSRNDVLAYDPAEWDKSLKINLNAPLEFCRAVAPSMRDKGWGRIVNVGSSFSAQGSVLNRRGGGADYCLAKATVQALTKLLAHEMAPHGVTVNAVAPGIVDTPMHPRGSAAMSEKYSPMIPMGRLAQPSDIAPVVVFLVSPAASYITGQTIHVNGGMVMVD